MCFKSKTATYGICELETRIGTAHKIFMRNLGVKRPLRKFNPIGGDNIKMDLRYV
jgi:hypothetical protein